MLIWFVLVSISYIDMWLGVINITNAKRQMPSQKSGIWQKINEKLCAFCLATWEEELKSQSIKIELILILTQKWIKFDSFFFFYYILIFGCQYSHIMRATKTCIYGVHIQHKRIHMYIYMNMCCGALVRNCVVKLNLLYSCTSLYFCFLFWL